ncbi:hypothetical protein ROJ8625_00306 [Roseivivax jejudonensis]|uniref:Uncharacterized protein n=1 Tax=Roseivivax jejudonensis TaxID=1529041 RepID=A0A1X6Y6H5_9RHOB|nr:hypothetical protein ROJ8625_00306 [Roseivivax jejudonensis]
MYTDTSDRILGPSFDATRRWAQAPAAPGFSCLGGSRKAEDPLGGTVPGKTNHRGRRIACVTRGMR